MVNDFDLNGDMEVRSDVSSVPTASDELISHIGRGCGWPGVKQKIDEDKEDDVESLDLFGLFDTRDVGGMRATLVSCVKTDGVEVSN